MASAVELFPVCLQGKSCDQNVQCICSLLYIPLSIINFVQQNPVTLSQTVWRSCAENQNSQFQFTYLVQLHNTFTQLSVSILLIKFCSIYLLQRRPIKTDSSRFKRKKTANKYMKLYCFQRLESLKDRSCSTQKVLKASNN